MEEQDHGASVSRFILRCTLPIAQRVLAERGRAQPQGNKALCRLVNLIDKATRHPGWRIQQFGNVFDVVWQGGIVPTMLGVARQTNGEQHIAHRGVLGMLAVADADHLGE